MTKDYEIRVFTALNGNKKLYAFISLRNGREKGHSFDEIIEAVARVKHDKIGTLYNFRVGFINRYTDGVDGLWFIPQYAGLDCTRCWVCWKGKLDD